MRRRSRRCAATAPSCRARRRRPNWVGKASPTAPETAHPQPVGPHPHERRLERRERGRACVRDGPAGPWDRWRRFDPDPVRLLRPPRLKPTYGRVPAWPASPFGSVAHAGPMARTVTDLALLLDVMVEPDARDWTALMAPAGSFSEGLEQGVTGMRMAFSADLGYASVDGEVAAALERAARAFQTLGAHVEAVDPGFDNPRETFEVLWAAGAARAAADLGAEPPQGIDPGLATTVAVGGRIALLDYLAEQHRRDDLGRRSSLFLADWDALLTPTLPIPAFGAGRDVARGLGPRRLVVVDAVHLPVQPHSAAGGDRTVQFARSGLPIGLQIVGPRHRGRARPPHCASLRVGISANHADDTRHPWLSGPRERSCHDGFRPDGDRLTSNTV